MRRGRNREDVTANDVYLNSFAYVAALVVLLIFLINPPTEESSEPPPGSLSIYAVWPEGNTDVDIWVNGPDEPSPVGYSNKTGVNFSLLRDDTGNGFDISPGNFENAYSREVPAGDYTINLHCFRCPEPITVHIEVRLILPGQKPRELFRSKVTLQKNWEEVTVVRFRMKADSVLDRGSLHNVFTSLRGG